MSAFTLHVRRYMKAMKAWKDARAAFHVANLERAVGPDIDHDAEDKDFFRGDGYVECGFCGMPYRNHPEHPKDVTSRALCSGKRVHL